MSQERGPQIEDIKRAAFANAPAVLAALGVRDEPDRAGLILISSPVRKDVHPSFAIWIKRGAIAFKDFGTDEHGDLIGLVVHLKRWEHLPKKGIPEARRFLIELLRLGNVSREQRARDDAASRRLAAEAEKKDAEQDARNQARARKLWIEAPPVWGQAIAERYIGQARGLDFSTLPKGPRGGDRRPDILHFSAREKHIWQGKRKDDAHNGEVSYWPCVVSPCVDFSGDGKGVIRAIHRCYIARDGAGKAPVEPPRKCWPATAGLVIPLWRGDSGLSVVEANACGLRETFVLTEGWEDGYSAVLAAPQHRAWAAISLSNLAAVAAVLPACCDSVIVHQQNDWLKPQAVKAFESALAALEASGRAVAVVKAFSGKDLNDTLRGED